MATLHTAGRIQVRVYPRDHAPPHFHVITPQSEAVVRIEDLAVIAGTLTPSTRRKVWGWITENKALIAGEWTRLHPDRHGE